MHSSKSANNIAREQVANAVGSQIINVFIGLGLPYAIAGSSPLNTGGASTISTQPEATATLCPNETRVLAWAEQVACWLAQVWLCTSRA